MSPTIPSTGITASEVRTSEPTGATIPKMIDSSMKEITPVATATSNNGTRQDSTNYEVQMMEFTAPLEKDEKEHFLTSNYPYQVIPELVTSLWQTLI